MNKANDQHLKFYSRADVATMFGVSRPTLHRLMRNGSIHYAKIGSRTIFTQKNVHDFIKRVSCNGKKLAGAPKETA